MSMIKWIRTSRLSIKKSLPAGERAEGLAEQPAALAGLVGQHGPFHWLRLDRPGRLSIKNSLPAGERAEGLAEQPAALAGLVGQHGPFHWLCLDRPGYHARADCILFVVFYRDIKRYVPRLP